jgi:dolichol-phosphate mannosyltransferase
MTSVALVMPVYNEADGIADFLYEIDGVLPGIEMFVVNDCSTDSTLAVLEGLDFRNVRLCVVTNDHNSGHGSSTLRALDLGLSSGAEVVVAVDGDGQLQAHGIRALVDAVLGSGQPVIEGIRVGREESLYRRAVSLVTRMITGVRVRALVADANTPFRAYRREALVRLLEVVPRDSMVPNLWMTVVSRRMGFAVGTEHIPTRPRRGATSRGSTWGRSRVSVPSRRFVRFCMRAIGEWLVQWPSVRRAMRRSSAR